jgi:hypothetical protein
MSVRELSATYRQLSTPPANLCLATSVSTAAVAGLAAAVDQLIIAWPIASGMLVVSAFHLVVGTGCLIQRSVRSGRFVTAIADPLRSLAKNAQRFCLDDCLDDEEGVTLPAGEVDERRAIHESCLWAG